MSLEERTKVLEEKIAIEELKNTNKTTQDSISQLESKICELEKKLGEVSREPDAQKHEPVEPSPFEAPQATQTTPETAEPIAEYSEEETFAITAPEEPMMTEPETLGESKKTHEKKKRKYF